MSSLNEVDDMEDVVVEESINMIFVLDIDSSTSKYNCPLTTCAYQSSSIPSILNHMWKFKKKNPVNKSCTGQNSPCITLYPKLFYDSKFEENTHPTFKQEYPHYKWQIIQKYINPPDDSPPNIISLIKEFNIFITTDFLQNYPHIKIPSSLQHFILDPDFEPDDLPSILASIQAPAHKKRKISKHESFEIEPQTTLSLPSLNMSPNSSSHSNSMIHQLSCSNNTSLSFDLNQYKNNINQLSVLIPHSHSHNHNHNHSHIAMNNMNNNNRKRKRKRRSIGPLCSACNTEINPCHTMIKCIECMTNDASEVIICITCFKSGREFIKHKRFHKYNVLPPLIDFKLQNNNAIDNDNNNKSVRKNKLSHNKWSASDEWNLLSGIRRYGLGNWSGITKIINKNNINPDNIKHFDYKHVEAHFHLKYKDKVHKNSNIETDEIEIEHKNNHNHRKKTRRYCLNKLSQNKESNSNAKFTEKHKLKCGYRELRDEFEAEWNNDAEAMIGDMYFSEYDSKQERALKMEGLSLYNKVLQERKVRKKFIKEYGVIYGRRGRNTINRRSMSESELKMEQDIGNNLSKFARYTADKNHNFSEFKSLVSGLMEEKRLREKIYKLRHYLLNGITSVSKMNCIEKYVARQEELAMSHNNNEEYDEDDDILMNFKSSDEFLNTYNGCSLDAISTYLTLIEEENLNGPKKNKKNKNKNMHYDEEDVFDGDDNDNDGDEGVGFGDWNLKKMDGFGKLNEGEKKLCNILKIGGNDYKWIERQISKRVYLHGLLNKNKVPQQLYVDIDDIKNVQNTMVMRIGLVDPRILSNDIVKPKQKK